MLSSADFSGFFSKCNLPLKIFIILKCFIRDTPGISEQDENRSTKMTKVILVS